MYYGGYAEDQTTTICYSSVYCGSDVVNIAVVGNSVDGTAVGLPMVDDIGSVAACCQIIIARAVADDFVVGIDSKVLRL